MYADIWTAPVGQQVDLGELRTGPDPDRLPGLSVAAQALDVVAAHLGHASGTHLADLSWHPADLAGPCRLALTLVDRPSGTGMAALRLYAVDPAGDRQVLADLRCRRTAPRTPPAGDLLTSPVGLDEQHRRSFPVTDDLVTDHVPDAPAVLSTPALIAMMEDTAADILRPRWAAGTASVGTWIGVRHVGAALRDEQVEVSARVADIRGRRITFDVRAWVGDRPIGEGQVGQTLIRGGHRQPRLPRTSQ